MSDEGRQEQLKQRARKYGLIDLSTKEGQEKAKTHGYGSRHMDEPKVRLPSRHPGLDARGRLNTPEKQMSWKDVHRLANEIRPTQHSLRNEPRVIAERIKHNILRLMDAPLDKTSEIESSLLRDGVSKEHVVRLLEEKTKRALRNRRVK